MAIRRRRRVQIRDSATVASSSFASPPTRAAGDDLHMFAWRDGVSGVPTVPSGWFEVVSTATPSGSFVYARRRCTGSSMSLGTWTNATHLCCVVVKAGTGRAGMVLGNFSSAAATAQTQTWGATALQSLRGHARMLLFYAQRTATSTTTAPAGATLLSRVEGTAPLVGAYLSAPVDRWTSPLSIEFSASAHGRLIAIELLDGDEEPAYTPEFRAAVGTVGDTPSALPTYEIGDLLVTVAYNSASATIPPVASAAWVSVATLTQSSNAIQCAIRIATAKDLVPGTWTNANYVIQASYKCPQSLRHTILRGAVSSTRTVGSSSSNSIAWQAPGLDFPGIELMLAMATHSAASDVDSAFDPEFAVRATAGTGPMVVLADSAGPRRQAAPSSFTVNATGIRMSINFGLRPGERPVGPATHLLRGTVTHPTGGSAAELAGALVRAVHAESHECYYGEVDATGAYEIVCPAGDYHITVEVEGEGSGPTPGLGSHLYKYRSLYDWPSGQES